MSQGLPVKRLINVAVSLSATGAAFANFNATLIVGSSNVIDTQQRIVPFGTLEDVGVYFSSTEPEYLAAELYFGQTPQPDLLYIGRWAATATSGFNQGGALTVTQQLISNWTTITDGGFHVTIDGTVHSIIGLNFSAASNLNAVAAIIQAALPGGVTCTWSNFNDAKFQITSATTGTASTVSALTAGTSGSTDISAQLMMTASTLTKLVSGIAAETPLQAVTIMDDLPTPWYLLTFAPQLTDGQNLAVAAYIEAAGNPHLYAISTSEAACINYPDTTSIIYQIQQLAYERTFCWYSSTTPYISAAVLGIMATVDFTQNASTITLAYKTLAGVVPELLTGTQADAMNNQFESPPGNNGNYYADFNNGTATTVNGITGSGIFIDAIWGADWLANQIQTDYYNLLISLPKLPQTDAGANLGANAIAAACNAGVNNGLIAPGKWNAAGFGQLATGGNLPTGYYIFTPPVASQAEVDRAARKSVPYQVAVKLAGAVQNVMISVTVNQ